jgi:23S rRNA G2445 N2-methylase RlmL
MGGEDPMKKDITKLKDSFFASCPRGLEELITQELKALKVTDIQPTEGGVRFNAPLIKAIELVMTTRYASRIYKELYQFSIGKEKDLYHLARQIKWKSVLPLDQTFNIHCVLGQNSQKKRSHFKNNMYMGLTLKDAIVDWFRQETKDRPDVEKHDASVSFYMFIAPKENIHSSKEEVTIGIDMGGYPLHQRGYRRMGFRAPLKENLAAALCHRIQNDAKGGFWDVMCGSGTMLIEMAYLLSGMPTCAPQLLDETEYWAFQNHLYFVKDKYAVEDFKKLKEDLKKKIEKAQKNLAKLPPIIGSDIENKSLEITKECLLRAGLADYVQVKRQDATNVSPEFEKGALFANPPYGERMGDEKELQDLYYRLGENLKQNAKENSAFIFTGNLPLIKKISLRSSKKDIFFNGAIESRLVKYELY